MKKYLVLFALVISIASNTMAQAAAKEADPKDVASLDAIMKAVYDVISGDAGKERDWDRFRSLFYKDARLIPSGKNPQTGVIGARVLTPDDYVKASGPYLVKNGFHEREIARHIDQWGNIAQVFSTYASFHKSDDKDPFMRGINSFQLLNDGKRWWVLNIYWQQESPENPIPKEYLKNKK
ncbi:MAG: hypothetical protein ABJB34_12190 [Acidobacteriota bacterium]